MPIYTKIGDNGDTGLYENEKRFRKSNLIFDVLGTIDELNATLGFLHTSRIKEVTVVIYEVQRDLFSMGAAIAGKDFNGKYWDEKIEMLEKHIDFLDSKNEPLKKFILPGGSLPSSQLHIARAVCRRLERLLVTYIEENSKKDLEIFQKYINRLSDLLFVLSRFANKTLGVKDLVWEE